ncbi:MAG: hypothetical protein AAB652_02820 [Patescibacteria group bacterium]
MVITKEGKLIIVAVIIVLVVLTAWYFLQKQSATQAPLFDGANQAPSSTPDASQSLGGELYQKSSNPIGDKLPATNNPIKDANPIEGLYQNPF